MFVRLFPINPKTYEGYRLVRVLTYLFLFIVVVRSTVHLFAPDGGANSIAGIDVSGPDGNNVIALFHQWGAIQLVLATVLLVLFIFYQGLTPLVILFLSFDAPMRALAGQMGKIESSHTPPGEALNWPAFFFLVVLFIVSLRENKTKH